MAPTTILFIGCGNMGAAIAGGALRQIPNVRVVALDPDVARARNLLPAGAAVELYGQPTELIGLKPHVVILGVKPQSFSTLGDDVLALLRKAPVVSIMAGIGLDVLAKTLAPAQVVRVMPNLPALVGQGMSLGCAVGVLPPKIKALIANIFGAIGRFDWVEAEDLLELAAPVYACGPGFVFAFAEQMILAAERQGVGRALAERLVHQTFMGAATMLCEDTRGAAGLKQAVSSPGGTTLAGLSVLEPALPPALSGMLAAAQARAVELARLATV